MTEGYEGRLGMKAGNEGWEKRLVGREFNKAGKEGRKEGRKVN